MLKFFIYYEVIGQVIVEFLGDQYEEEDYFFLEFSIIDRLQRYDFFTFNVNNEDIRSVNYLYSMFYSLEFLIEIFLGRNVLNVYSFNYTEVLYRRVRILYREEREDEYRERFFSLVERSEDRRNCFFLLRSKSNIR